MKKSVRTTINNLEAHGFEVKYFTDRDEAIEILLKEISTQESVGFGSSMTVKELGIFARISRRQYKVYNPSKATKPETRHSLCVRAALADIYICGTNSITEDGRLINIDTNGNRLSSILYGHKKVFILAGVNKISKSFELAMNRIKEEAYNATLILDRCPGSQPISIYLLEEGLGYQPQKRQKSKSG